MKRRTYEYYVVARNLGRDNEELVHRADKLDEATKKYDQARSGTKEGDTVYLCRLNVIEKTEI